jgi:hypothetical protein
MHTGLQWGNLRERELLNGQMAWTRCICIFEVRVTVHHDKFLIIDAPNSQIYFGMKFYVFRTVPLSIIMSFPLYTQQWYMS